MKGKTLQEQIDLAYAELEIIASGTEPGAGAWRLQRRYIDGLEFAIDVLRLEERKVKALEDISDRLCRIEDTMKLLVRATDNGMVIS